MQHAFHLNSLKQQSDSLTTSNASRADSILEFLAPVKKDKNNK